MSDSSSLIDPSRRALLRRLAAAGVGAAFVALGGAAAQEQGMPGGMPGGGHGGGMGGGMHGGGMGGGMHGGGMGGGMQGGAMGDHAHGDGSPTPPPAGAATGPAHRHEIPWAESCAFCGMTLTTPAGMPQGALFRERTYAQWAFAGEARHFESIDCALGYAYAHGVRDGEGASLYVAAYDLTALPSAADLTVGRDATFLWAERLPASMMARVGAFAAYTDALAYATTHAADLGRRRFVDLTLLEDMAPLPIANLVPLLARQLG
jgi:hypothetical protein